MKVKNMKEENIFECRHQDKNILGRLLILVFFWMAVKTGIDCVGRDDTISIEVVKDVDIYGIDIIPDTDFNFYSFARTYEGIKESSYANFVQEIRDGRFIVAGERGKSSSGKYRPNMAIIKLSPSGDMLWQKSYEGGEAFYINQTRDGGFIVGGWRHNDVSIKDGWVLKLNEEGNIEWQKVYYIDEYDPHYPHKKSLIEVNSVFEISDGGYIIAGRAEYYNFDHEYDYWFAKLNSSGDIEWLRTYEDGGQNYFTSIQGTKDGGYIISGTTFYIDSNYGSILILKVKANGDIDWQKSYYGGGASSIQQTRDGGYILAGNTNSFGAGGQDIWILKLRGDGNIEWQKTYGGSGLDHASSIQQTRDGGYVLVGTLATSSDCGMNLWILKLEKNGDIEWDKIFVGSGHRAYIQQTSDEGYIVAWGTEPYGTDANDIWILKMKPDRTIDGRCEKNITGIPYSVVDDTDISPDNTTINSQNTDAVTKEVSLHSLNINLKVKDVCKSNN
ncbi:MAG: hypothetical protein ACP5QK_13175 [Myxococcota bacterium]